MSPAFNGSSALEYVERSNAIEICNGSVKFLPRTGINMNLVVREVQ